MGLLAWNTQGRKPGHVSYLTQVSEKHPQEEEESEEWDFSVEKSFQEKSRGPGLSRTQKTIVSFPYGCGLHQRKGATSGLLLQRSLDLGHGGCQTS